jgi:hypothetical protein
MADFVLPAETDGTCGGNELIFALAVVDFELPVFFY